jgi:hypothetical protein
MFDLALEVMKRPRRALSAFLRNPREAWIEYTDWFVHHPHEQRRPPCLYEADPDWERKLCSLIDAPVPAEDGGEFAALWRRVLDEMDTASVRTGPEAFGDWNDGDPAFVRAIWRLVRQLRPRNVVETGVAHGVTSRFILEALEKNGQGHLWSIDLLMDKRLKPEIGVAVGGRFPHRWTYIEGSSRLRLPSLLARLGEVDLFVHDGLHQEFTVRFELDHVWPSLRPGGAIVVDDIDTNWGFHSFTEDHPGEPNVVCEADPIRPDLRRFNDKGLFGIIRKRPADRDRPQRH